MAVIKELPQSVNLTNEMHPRAQTAIVSGVDDFLWFTLSVLSFMVRPTMSEQSILPPTWHVPEDFRKRLGSRVGRQRQMVADDHLLLVLHAPPKPDQTDRIGRYFWRSPDGQWMSKEFGTGINALNKHLDEYEDALAKLDRREEAAHNASEYFEILEQLMPLQRASRNLYLVLQEARKACPDVRELIDARDRAYEIERTADLLCSGTKNALDVLVARRAEEQSKSSERVSAAAHRLNILAALFFPIATLTAIFGTNLRHGLEEAAPPFIFLGIVVLGFILGGLLTVFLTLPPRAERNEQSQTPRR